MGRDADRQAFNHADPDQGLADARRLATELDKKWPDAAGSLREGLADMFTVSRLGTDGRLAKTLTNSGWGNLPGLQLRQGFALLAK